MAKMKNNHTQDHIQIIYDDLTSATKFECGKGFACIIDFAGEKILFDLGGNFKKFVHNCHQLAIDLNLINHVVISHRHWDHCAGLDSLITNLATNCQIILPSSFRNNIVTNNRNIRYIDHGSLNVIHPSIFTLGFKSRWWGIPIIEQVLILQHHKGLIILTGCAHAGIMQIVNKIEQSFKDQIYLLIGGFHLSYHSKAKITTLINRLNSKEIAQVAPCHCTSIKGRQLFKSLFHHRVYDVGSGTEIML